MFYQQAFDFYVFCQILGFSEKNFFEIFIVDICVRRCKKLRKEWQHGADVADLFFPCFEKMHF